MDSAESTGRFVMLIGGLSDADAQVRRSLLQAQGVTAIVRIGHIPGISTLWVEEEHRDLADTVLQIGEESEPPGPDQVCPSCGEVSPPNFGMCWSCSASFPEG